MKPKEVNVLGKIYKVEYVDRPVDVTPEDYDAAWGVVNFFKRTIRIYDNGHAEDIFETLLHEILHTIEDALDLKVFQSDEGHRELGIVALALADVLIRNKWVNLKEKK